MIPGAVRLEELVEVSGAERSDGARDRRGFLAAAEELSPWAVGALAVRAGVRLPWFPGVARRPEFAERHPHVALRVLPSGFGRMDLHEAAGAFPGGGDYDALDVGVAARFRDADGAGG